MLKGTVIFAAAAIFMAQTAFADDASGKCGDNAYWSYEDGTLTISGTGESYDIDRDYLSWQKPDWAEYEDEIENVVVKEGITSIGRQLFRGSPLKTISLPKSLESIGYQTFQASALTALTIPSAQTAVNTTSFENCRELAEITMPEELYTDAAQLFGSTLWYDSMLEKNGMLILGDVLAGVRSDDEAAEIIVPKGVRTIGMYAFKDTKAERIILPDGVEELYKYSFYDADIREVTLPDSLKAIGGRAFLYSSLEKVTIPESVTSIEELAFCGCKQLSEAYLPDSLTELPPSMFSGCISLKSVRTSPRLEKIYANAFFGCISLERFDFPKTLAVIGTRAFCGSGLTYAVLPDSVSEIGENVFSDSELREVRLPAGIRIIPKRMLAGCKIEEVTLPDTVEEIGDSAFAYCKTLKTINFPSSLKMIGESAFAYCELLDPPPLGEGITSVGALAFSKTAVKSAHLRSGLELAYGIYYDCPYLTEAVFDYGCDAVEDSLFCGCISLRSVSLPSTICTIGNAAFMKCEQLEEINIPDAVNEIGIRAFRSSGIRDIKIPEGVRVISEECFSGCASLEGIALPFALEELGDDAFYKCEALEEIDIPETVTAVGKSAFRDCISLKKADLPPHITAVSMSCFSECPLEDMYVPEGVKEIGAYAFTAALSVHIPPSVMRIGTSALPKDGTVYAQEGSYAYGLAVKRAVNVVPDYQRQVGDVIDHIVSSDIYVTMNGELIPSYCISGRTVVLLRDLENHGFDVWYDEVNKKANADYNADKPVTPEERVRLANDEILYTDIVGMVNGVELECVNTNGYIGIEAERLGNYVPDISCVWQPLYRRLQMQSFKGMAHFDDLVNAISDRKGIEMGEGCKSFADTENSRYDVFTGRGYISKADYNGYIYPMRGLRMSDFILTAGRVFYETDLDYEGHKSYGTGLKTELRGTRFPSYLTLYANYMYDNGILVPDENGKIYLDGILTREQMEYYLDVLSM